MKATLLGCAAAAALFAAIGAAQAATYDVTVWGGYGNSPITGVSPDDAQLPVPTGADTASFTWTGSIDWVNNTPNCNCNDPTQNQFGAFFKGGTISGYLSGVGLPEADFLTTSMSDLGNDWYTYVYVTGTTGAGTATISHDDGASVYQFGSNLYLSPGQTSEISSSFAIGSGAFSISYIEANGSPSDLVFSVVPEPSTWAMMGLGFAALGFAGYRKARKAPAFV